jgi:hypothetical protein
MASKLLVVPNTPILHHDSPFFHDGFISIVMIGKSGCGKTRLLTEMLPTISPKVRTVIIATVIHNNQHHNAIVNYYKAKNCVTGVTHNPDELAQFVKMCEAYKHVNLNKQGLIIFDDFNVGKKTGPYWDCIVNAYTKLRNDGWNFILLAQDPAFIPPIVRNNTTGRIFFDCYSKSARTTFLKDFRDRIPDERVLDLLTTWIRTIQYSYLLIRDNPFEVSAGELSDVKTVVKGDSVIAPTLNELMDELGVDSYQELKEKAYALEAKAGNTSSKLFT